MVKNHRLYSDKPKAGTADCNCVLCYKQAARRGPAHHFVAINYREVNCTKAFTTVVRDGNKTQLGVIEINDWLAVLVAQKW